MPRKVKEEEQQIDVTTTPVKKETFIIMIHLGIENCYFINMKF